MITKICRRVAIGLVFAVPWMLLVSGCKDCNADKPQAPSVIQMPEVPAPAHLVADVFIANPEQVYVDARRNFGGPLSMLPATFASGVVITLGLSATLLDQIDGKSPLFGVITDDGKSPDFVLGIKLQNGMRAVQLLTSGKGAKYTSKPPVSGVIALEPTANATSQPVALAIAGDYLLAGRSARGLIASGGYVVGTLPKSPLAQRRSDNDSQLLVQLNQASLHGPVSERLRQLWTTFRNDREKEYQQQVDKAGRPADFGEPKEALSQLDQRAQAVISIIDSLKQATVSVGMNDAITHVSVKMVPQPGDGAAAKKFAELTTGDIAPLLALPRDTIAGVLFRDTAAQRLASGKQKAEDLLAMLGPRIKEPDKERVYETFKTWQAGRGDWLVAGLVHASSNLYGMVQGSTSDPASIDKAIRSAISLTSAPGFREPIEHHVGKLTLGRTTQLPHGAFVPVKREKKDKDGAVTTMEFDLGWHLGTQGNSNLFNVRLQENASEWLASLQASPENTDPAKKDTMQHSLGNHPVSSRVFTGIPPKASFVLFVDPKFAMASLLGSMVVNSTQNLNSPVVFAYGGEATEAWCNVGVGNETLKELIKSLNQQKK